MGRREEGHFWEGFQISGWERWNRKGHHSLGEGRIGFGEREREKTVNSVRKQK